MATNDEKDRMIDEVLQAIRTHKPTALPAHVTIDHVARTVTIEAQDTINEALGRINGVTLDYKVTATVPKTAGLI